MNTVCFDILKSEFEIKDKTTVALGIFDGVHKAHTALIKKAVETAEKEGFLSVVFTFSQSPKNNAGYITKNSLKEKYINNLNPDYLLVQEMNKEFMSLSPEEFIKTLKEKFNVSKVFVGENFTFGKNKAGNTKLLELLGEKYGFSVCSEELKKEDGEVISSSVVRDCLKSGDVEKAEKILGRKYEISGITETGNKLGRTINFPTANIYPDENMLIPKYGVYKTATFISGKEYKSITNVGVKPTVEKNRLSIETHILDFKGDLYGKEIYVKFEKFIRPETKFESLEELKKQISKDIEKANED